MSNQPINTGTTIGDGTGDGFHASCLKINANFAELYARAPAGLSGMLAADAGTGYYRVAVIADISFAGMPNGLATLDSGGKIPTGQLPASVLGALKYQTGWNASTNSPALATGVGTTGFYYIVTAAGTTSIDGNAAWSIGDWIVFDGTKWDKIDNNNLVSSVAGLAGAVTAAGLKTALAITYADVSGVVPNTLTVSAAGLATGGGALSSNQTITVPKAASTDVTTGTDDTKALTSLALAGATGTGANQYVKLNASSKLPAVDGSLLTNMPSFSDKFSTQLLHVRDEKTNGTAGGTFTAGAWQTRTLNTVKTNEISGASLASNQVTLPAGTYFVSALAPALNCDRHRAKLYNVTDSADIIIGGGQYASNASSGCTDAHAHGRFTIAGTKVIELRHYCSTTGAFGQTAPDSSPEVYAAVEIWKVA